MSNSSPPTKDNRTLARQLTMSYANKAKRHEYKNGKQGGPMRQPHEREMTIYTDIGEVRTEVRVSDCNQMLENGWLLLGAYPLTMVGDPAQRFPCALTPLLGLQLSLPGGLPYAPVQLSLVSKRALFFRAADAYVQMLEKAQW